MRAAFSGTKPFPLEMLKEDECYPFTEQDILNILKSVRREEPGQCVVTLQKVNSKAWTISRWERLGWKLVKLYGG